MASDSPPRPRLQTQLLLLLLLFGVVPVSIVATLGYSVSRRTIIEQSEAALQELANRQAAYLQTEIRREHLILRTIAGQVAPAVSTSDDVDLAALLEGGLTDDGVFDGLRILKPNGAAIVDVALRETDPRWPTDPFQGPPAGLTLHLDGDSVIAYLLTVPVSMRGEARWLQGHVRSSDFPRNFDIPLHLLGGVELGVFDAAGHAIIVSHGHAEQDLRTLLDAVSIQPDKVIRAQIDGEAALGVATSLPELQWTIATALPLSIVLAPVNALAFFAIIGGTALILLILAAGHLAARHVTTPLRELSEATAAFGETGSYDNIVHGSVAEVQALIESFQAMAENLRRSRDEVAQLHDREMERAQQLATVGELASGVAHEIRNPLTGVIGALEVVRRKMTPTDEALPLIDEARSQLHRIESTTRRLLEYARPPELTFIRVDLVGIVERALRVVQSTAEKSRVECRLTCETRPCMVRADPESIVQVLVNLLLNGVEAADGGTLEIDVVQREHAFEVRVSDHGPGVTPERHKEIFRPFFTTKHQGTGLGLSISEQIVKRHGGSLWVEDTPGGGATFVIRLDAAGE